MLYFSFSDVLKISKCVSGVNMLSTHLFIRSSRCKIFTGFGKDHGCTRSLVIQKRGNLQFIEKWHLLHRNHLLWIHSYLWRPMFVDYQILLVHWDVILWITSFVYYTIWPFITLLHGDIKGNQQIQNHWSPTNNNDSE